MERYQKQILFDKLGRKGQERLLSSRVLIAGMGALGCMCASLLARAGVGFIRMIDKDTVDLGNLHRQILFTEEDARLRRPKVEAAAQHLKEINSGIGVDPVNAYLEGSNIDALCRDIDLVLDAVDNMKTRYLINLYCVGHKIPWIYAGVVGSEGMTAVFLPGGPCFACFTGCAEAEEEMNIRNCSTHGILNTLPAIVASYEVMEAIKILTGSEDVRRDLLYIDAWGNIMETIELTKDPDCPVCSFDPSVGRSNNQPK